MQFGRSCLIYRPNTLIVVYLSIAMGKLLYFLLPPAGITHKICEIAAEGPQVF
jgi:hypothetical protein